MCILIRVQPMKDSKANRLMENWQIHYPYRPGRNGNVLLGSLNISVYEDWSVCSKNRNCSFLQLDADSLRLLAYRHLLMETRNPSPHVVPSEHVEGPPRFQQAEKPTWSQIHCPYIFSSFLVVPDQGSEIQGTWVMVVPGLCACPTIAGHHSSCMMSFPHWVW